MTKDLSLKECEKEIKRLTVLVHLKNQRLRVVELRKEVGEIDKS